ncbi:MAG: hypothetical protein JST93_25165 [Acidobacteria bacterium]|nr:hypothetical protein [Acidobacteriota bacterium]
MKPSLLPAILAFSSITAFGQLPQVAVSHSQSYFRTQTTAVSMVRVNSFAPGAFNLGFTPDPNFTVTRINAPATWSCNLGSLSCSRANNGQNAFELIQFIATINANAPATITNQATLTGDGISSPRQASDSVPVYRPSKVVQWGANNFGQLAGLPAASGFTSVAHSFRTVQALTSDGAIVQWGNLSIETVAPPAGSGFLSMTCGTSHCAALALDGSIRAWGANTAGQLDNIPTGTGFVALAATDRSTIALTNEGRLVHWGNSDLTDFPTSNGFVAIAGGYAHGLALTFNGVVAQWGANNLGQRTGKPPGGGFKAIASPSYNGIAQRQDNTLLEWGTTSNNPTNGMYTGPVAAFGATGLSGAAWAMPSDGSIVIWGDVFTAYQPNKPTLPGYVIGSVAFGLNGANALLPLTDPAVNGGAGQSTLVNTAFSTPLSVIVRDALNNPIQGLAITFASPSGGPSATFSNGQTTIAVNTDASGVASTTATANANSGSYSVTASASGFNAASFGLTNQSPLALTAINQGGNTPIPPGALYSPGAGFLWVNFNQQPANVTDTANYLLVSRNDGQDPQTASCAALASGDVEAGVSSVSYNAPGNYAQVNFATFPATMRFKLLVCATNRLNAANSLTGAAATKLPADAISASFGSLPILAASSVTLNSAAGTPLGEGAALTAPITSLYVNMNSFPVASTVSTSSVKLFSGTPAVSGCSNPGTAITGAASLNGNAIVFTPASPLAAAGIYQLVVCGAVKGGNGALLGSIGVGSAGADFIRNFTISQTATTMSKTAGDGQSTVVNTQFATNLKVTVTDQTGAPMSGVAVTFSIVPGGNGAAASFASASTINTGADGTATAPALTAGSTAGAFTVVATAGSLTQTFNLTNIGLQGVTIVVPAGVGFSLNSVAYTGTQTVSLAPGSYLLSTAATQSLGAGTQAVFTGWSDSGNISHNITVASSPLNITGSFKTQYQLTVTAASGGTALPASPTFHDANAVVSVSATPNSGFYFTGWTGNVASPSAAATTVTMTAPVSITANFAAKVVPVITWNNPANILFGSALSAAQLNATTTIPGVFAYTPAAGTVLPVGANQTLSVTFTPTDTVQYLPATKTVTINVTSNGGTPANLAVTSVLSRDSGTQEIVVRITVANTGATTAANVRLTAVRIGSVATTAVLPALLGDIAFGQSATTTIRIPASAGLSGAATSLSITGQFATATNFGANVRVTLP